MADTTDTASTTASPTATAPIPETEDLSYAAAAADRRTEIERAMGELDLRDSNSVLFFGTTAQSTVAAGAHSQSYTLSPLSSLGSL